VTTPLREGLEHLTLLDLSDRELLLILRDVADGAGYALANDIATRLDLMGENPGRSVAVRLSWLVRYGAVEREHLRDAAGNIRYHRSGKVMTAQGWKLTELGVVIATGKLSKTQEKALEGMNDGSLLMATRWMAGRIASSNGTVGKLLDRQYRNGVGR